MGKKGKQQSRKSRKKELNKEYHQKKETEQERRHEVEYQRLQAKYGKKKQSTEEILDYLQRNFFIIRDIGANFKKEQWKDFWEQTLDPDFQVDYGREIEYWWGENNENYEKETFLTWVLNWEPDRNYTEFFSQCLSINYPEYIEIWLRLRRDWERKLEQL